MVTVVRKTSPRPISTSNTLLSVFFIYFINLSSLQCQKSYMHVTAKCNLKTTQRQSNRKLDKWFSVAGRVKRHPRPTHSYPEIGCRVYIVATDTPVELYQQINKSSETERPKIGHKLWPQCSSKTTQLFRPSSTMSLEMQKKNKLWRNRITTYCVESNWIGKLNGNAPDVTLNRKFRIFQ